MAYILGVDPGWAKCGVGVLETDGEKFELVVSKVLSPRDLWYKKTVEEISSLSPSFESVGIERFVTYKGTFSAASEDILMLIGALRLGLEPEPIVFRAIDWKGYLLRKLGLAAEGGKLDKKFSFQACEAICNTKPKTDHEADAICIAYTAYHLHRSKKS